MKIRLNGAPWETQAETLGALLCELTEREGLDASAVATAVNGEFAPKDVRDALRLAEDDAVEVISPRQGG